MSATPRLIFGREPAAITAAVMAAVALVSGFVLPVSVETTALIQTAVNAVLALVVVVMVRETILRWSPGGICRLSSRAPSSRRRRCSSGSCSPARR